MLIEHDGKRPSVDGTAWVAPTAVLSGDVTVGPHAQVGFGAVVLAQGSPVTIGTQSIVGETAIVRSTSDHPVRIGDYVLIGPRSALKGCIIEDEAFLATGTTVFHGARVGVGAEVRINGVVHLRTVVPDGGLVPIGWVAVGDPAEILPPGEHERIWAVQGPLDFPGYVWGVSAKSADGAERVDMKEVTGRRSDASCRHREDVVVDDGVGS